MIRFDRLRDCIKGLSHSPDPGNFTMVKYGYWEKSDGTGGCGTPACVLGHYRLQTEFKAIGIMEAPEHFGISPAQSVELFGCTGCGNARTPQQAIAYIKGFIKRHEPKPAQRPTSDLVADLMRKVEAAPLVDGVIDSPEYAHG